MFDSLIRDPEAIRGTIKIIDDQTVCTSACKLYYPARYYDTSLGSLGESTQILACFAIVIGNRYAVSRALATITLGDGEEETILIDGEPYIERSYQANDVIIKSNTYLLNKFMLYDIDNEFVVKGRYPAYMNYNDRVLLFMDSGRHTGVQLGNNIGITALIASKTNRSPLDGSTLFRHAINQKQVPVTQIPSSLGLRNVSEMASNTTAKLIGAYFDNSLKKAVVDQTDRHEAIEDILRM